MALFAASRKRKHETLSIIHCIGTNKFDAAYVHKEKKKEEKSKIDISRSWADMPIELVQLLLPRLSLVDCIRLPTVCKAWNSLYNPIQEAKVYPWLMYLVKDSSLWRLFDPVYGKEYNIDMTWLGFSKDISFHYSKDGWILVSKERKYFFLLNPLTRESVSIPYLDDYLETNKLVFSSAPTSQDCVLFRFRHFLDYFEISTWSPGEEEWSKMSFQDELFSWQVSMPCNPVFSCGEFYCFRTRGDLLVFDPKKKTWKVLQVKSPIEFELWRTIWECYLVESKGDLIMAFRGSITDPIRIFKLDKLNMVWSELDGMGDVTIFLDCRTSLAKPCPEKWFCNQICLSGFTRDHGKNNAFYSMDTKKYYPEIDYLLIEPVNCTWIEPNLTAA